MREIELKGVVTTEAIWRAALERAGARQTFEGQLIDRRYDTPEFVLRSRDEVLRMRTEISATSSETRLEHKGPASNVEGYKHRDEIGTTVGDATALGRILHSLGLVVTREIERDVVVYELDGTMVRFEHYPRMDTLAEIEGDPAGIEQAIRILGADRAHFTTGSLSDFVAEYERRTGQRAALCQRELAGDYRYRLDDA